MAARIPVPADKVRTREQILADATVIGARVWVTCHNCGGSGSYPSSMTPPGLCRFYCWAKPYTDPIAQAMGLLPPMKDRNDPTYGRRPVPVETFVKRAQAADRRDYRARVQWELDAPKREQAAREAEQRAEAERLEQERIAADIAARKAVSQWVGQPGERLELDLTVTRVAKYETRPFGRSWGSLVTRYVVTLRDAAGNVFTWFADYNRAQGERLRVKATVKEHSEYQGEKQTTIQRVKEL